MLPPGPIVSLVYRMPPERRADIVDFLRGAVPFYERPGGIRVGLYESADEPGLYLELVAYADERAYAADQERVERDAEMLATLGRFKAVVNGPVEVRRMRPVPELGADLVARAPLQSVRIEPAAYNDHAAIASLLAEAALPLPDEDDAPVTMIVARREQRVIACAGWERHGDVALLRSIAVCVGARGSGVGVAITRDAVARIEAQGARQIVLLTHDAAGLFAKLGFATIERAALPEVVRAARQVGTACCAGATCMMRSLPG